MTLGTQFRRNLEFFRRIDMGTRFRRNLEFFFTLWLKITLGTQFCQNLEFFRRIDDVIQTLCILGSG